MESIIVDANKVFAAFIAEGIVHELLFSGKFKPIGRETLTTLCKIVPFRTDALTVTEIFIQLVPPNIERWEYPRVISF